MTAARALFQAELRVCGIVVAADRVALKRLRKIGVFVRQIDLLHRRGKPARRAARAVRLQKPRDIGRVPVRKAPLKRHFTAVDKQALLIGAGRLKQRTCGLRGQPVRKAEMRGLHREGVAVLLHQLRAHAAGAKARHRFDPASRQSHKRGDRMRAVPERGQSHPVGRPVFHILIVRAAQELDPSQLSALDQLFDIKILVGVQRGFHHHVGFPAALYRVADCADPLHTGRHRHGAGTMLARVEHAHGLIRVVGNGRDQMHRVHAFIRQHFVERGIAAGDPVLLRHTIHQITVHITDPNLAHIRMIPPDRHKRAAEAQPDDHRLQLSVFHGDSPFPAAVRRMRIS